jgi:hypothetical protein
MEAIWLTIVALKGINAESFRLAVACDHRYLNIWSDDENK